MGKVTADWMPTVLTKLTHSNPLKDAVMAEREACAKIADTIDKQDEIDNGMAMTGAAGQVADAIRRRK